MIDNRVTVRLSQRKDAAIIDKLNELQNMGWGAVSDWIHDALHLMLEHESGTMTMENQNIVYVKPTKSPIIQAPPSMFNETAVTSVKENFNKTDEDDIKARFRLLNQD